jgi:uncharacterized protein (TIRG00374 family)
MTRWVPLVLGLVALVALAWWFGLSGVGEALRRAEPDRVVWYLVLTVMVVLCYCARWRSVARAVGTEVSLGRLVGARLAGDAVSTIVPSAKLAGEPVRVALLRAGGAPAGASTAAVALDRMLELIGNMLAVLAYVVVYWMTRRHAPGALGIGVAAVVLLAAMVALVVRLHRGHRPFAKLYEGRWRTRAPRLSPWLDGLQHLEAHLTHFFRAHPRTFAAGLMGALLTELLIVVQYHALFAAFGVHLDLPTLLLVLLGGGLSHAIPSPGAIGALEATQVVVVGAATGAPALGFVVGVIVRLHELLLMTAGMIALLLQGFSLRRLPVTTAERAAG